MLDFGWSEFFLIIVLAIVLMGPKDIPNVIYQFGRLVRRLQYMKFALSRQFDTFMEHNDLQELRRGGMLGEMKGDLRSALTPPSLSEKALAQKTEIHPAMDPDADPEGDAAYYADYPIVPQLLELPLEGGQGVKPRPSK